VTEEAHIIPEGEIEDVVSITGRGFILFLKEGWRGAVPFFGVVTGNRGSANYFGVDVPRRVDGAITLGVPVQDETAKEKFQVGDVVKFYPRAATAAETEVLRRMERQSRTTPRDWKSWLGKLFRR
jgi:hypothetical protein